VSGSPRSGEIPMENVMMKLVVVVSGFIFALDAVPAARAQVTLDVAKITCDQFAGYKITNPPKHRDLAKRLS
jgi:hypothetical protein